ncbi:MAG: UvrD-helicase domain-containing protein, partial [Ruminiclostridium sp.]|nr:UvrD-helicase domain-containing protein [Ruminiclostridium sp.]
EIFRLLSDNKKNLYLVGDMKQSIYRFRGADPLVFSRLMKDPDFEVIRLNRNFRSCAQVIDSANAIFTGTMTEELGDVNYDKDSALVQGMKYDTDESNRTELITFTGGNAETNRRSEAAYIADRIKDMVNGGFRVTEGKDKRPCRYGDIAVIMGKYSRNIGIYKEALDRAGVPYDAKDNDEYTDFSEVKHALSLLRVIDDPYRDSDLAAVLMKEPYMLSAEEMAEIKLAAGRGGSLWSGLSKYARNNARAQAVLRELNGYREFAEQNSAERLIRRICDESMLIPAVEAAPEGAKKSANLHKLIYFAEKFSGGESASLYDFIKYMELIKSGNVKLSEAKGGTGGNAVRLMTIHGSKGLEFPVCFISNLTSRDKSMSDELICSPDFGIGMKISDTANMLKVNTQTYSMVSDELKRLGRSEEMRLLYVAATRAKEKMIFTAPVSNGEPDMHYGWVLKSGAVNADPSKSIILVRPLGIYEPKSEAVRAEESSGEAEIPTFTEYAYKRISAVPSKVTATQIGVKSVDDFSEQSETMDRFMRIPSFVSGGEGSKLTGKKRGDAYHKVMELLDFCAKPEDVPRLLDEMLENRKISEIERASVSEDDIARFLTCGLCGRAAKSAEVHRESPIFFEYVPEAGEWGVEDWTGEEKPFIQGIADMYFVENGEIVLVDYKTNSRVTAAQLTEEYRGQLDIYARALAEATGMRVKQKLLYSFELGEIEVK